MHPYPIYLDLKVAEVITLFNKNTYIGPKYSPEEFDYNLTGLNQVKIFLPK